MNTNKAKCDDASRWHAFKSILGITVLSFLMLVSIAGCVSFAGIPNSSSNNVFILNKSDEAITAFDKAIEINPLDSMIWCNKGLTLAHLGKLDEAIKAYDKAIEINPHNSYTWGGKGIVLYNLNKSDEAITAYDKAIEINPRNAYGWSNKGDVLVKLGKSNEAIKAYGKATEIVSEIKSHNSIL